MGRILASLAFALSFGAGFVGVAATPTADCCIALYRRFPLDVYTRNSTGWESERTDFWSQTEHLFPSCVFMPDTPFKVSTAVRLFTQRSCRFAIKSGGHSAIPGAANINDGVLMALERINDTVINRSEGYAISGPGLRLGQVYSATDAYGVVPILGRYATVGVGLAVGAGLSYLGNAEGLTVDNVLNYEVVLWNGRIVNANATSNTDLFWALKGGNNNFGVVTHFKFRAFNYTRIYGGLITYPESSIERLTDVVYDYHVRQAVQDIRTHTLPLYVIDPVSNTTTSLTPVVYNEDVHELPSIMRGWTDVPYTSNTLQNRQYSNLSAELVEGYPDGQVQEQRTFTVYADRQLYRDLLANHRAWLSQWAQIPGIGGLHVNMPITPNAIQQGVLKGGNALGLDDAEPGRVLAVVYYGLTFNNLTDEASILDAHAKFVESQRELARQRGLLYRYIMLTYSAFDQAAIAGYGPSNVARLQRIAKKYDPQGVFQRLVPGGQKLPRTDRQ